MVERIAQAAAGKATDPQQAATQATTAIDTGAAQELLARLAEGSRAAA